MSLRPVLCASIAFAALLLPACVGGESMEETIVEPSTEPVVTWKFAGVVDGRAVREFTLENGRGMLARLNEYGATLTELWVPGRDGNRADVVLGFDDVGGYVAGSPYFGCIAGRCANRIAGGKFSIDGVEYALAVNNGPNHLHGGVKGFDKRVWTGEALNLDEGKVGVRFTYLSADGEEGYPGNLTVAVVYELDVEGRLIVDMTARSDRATPVNLVHHSYWNLAGQASGDILGHELELASSAITATDATLIPTGERLDVTGTPYDFRSRKAIGQDIGTLQRESGAGHGGGYDTNFIIDGADGSMRFCARLHDPSSGRTMVIQSDQPGIQFYTGNFLDGSLVGKRHAVYAKYQGLCLETQLWPDAVNHADFPDAVLRPDRIYRHRMIHTFSVE